jgi:hypothetical protein
MGILRLYAIGHDLDQLKADGCQLVEPKAMFDALYLASNGDPCETGCTHFKDGKCPAYLKHHSNPVEKKSQAAAEYARSQTDQSGLIGGKWLGMTTAQIIAAEGISRGEFQKRKQAGHYKD